MSQTVFQKFEDPLDREQSFEAYFKSRLGEIGAVFGNAYIEGLRLVWVSGTSIKVKTGAADIPDGSRRLRVTADITVTGIALGNNAWGHVYLYNNAGVPAVEVVTTDPLHYFGSAYQKTGANTRRYLGSVRTDGSGNIFKFEHFLNTVYYLVDVSASPFRCLPGGTATTETDVDLSAVVPATAQVAILNVINTANVDMYVGNSNDTSSIGLFVMQTGTRGEVELILTSAQRANYKMASAVGSGGGNIDVRAYRFER